MITVIRVGTNAGAPLAKGASQVPIVAIIVALNGCVATVGVSPVPCSSLPWN